MNLNAIQAGLFVIIVALRVKPVGVYLERVFERRRTLLDPLLLPLERLIHGPMGIDPKSEMDWKGYSHCLLRRENAVGSSDDDHGAHLHLTHLVHTYEITRFL